jgi:hypothetical protein
MKNNFGAAKFLNVALLVSTLLCLPACDWFKGASDCSTCDSHTAKEAVVSFGSKVVVTGADFDEKLSMLFKLKPGVDAMIAQMPADQQAHIYEQIAEGIVAEKMIQQYVSDQGLDRTVEFKQNLKQAREAIENQLVLQAFQNALLAEIEKEMTEDATLKYYNENCTKLPIFKQAPFLVNAAGTKVEVVIFDAEQAAHDFAAKAKADFAKAAHDAKKSISHHVVHDKSVDVDDAVRAKVLATKSFPTVVVIKQKNGKFAAVKVVAHQEEMFAPCDKVQDHVKQIMSQEKFAQAYNNKINALKEQLKVTVSKEYFDKRFKKEVAAEVAPAAASVEASEEEAPEKAA